MNRKGEIRVRFAKEFNVCYREVSGLDDEWFVSADFKLIPGERTTSMQLIKELLSHRARTQPTSEYNCGSVFRNPTGHYAANLIESCGFEGILYWQGHGFPKTCEFYYKP